MGNVFGKPESERINDIRVKLQTSIRTLESQKIQHQFSEPRMIQEMRQCAKNNDMRSLNTLAKSLIRSRKQTTQYNMMISHVRSVYSSLTTLSQTTELVNNIKEMVPLMKKINAQIKMPDLHRTMHELTKQMNIIDWKNDMIGEAIDGLDDAEDEENVDEAVKSILEELHLDQVAAMPDAPRTGIRHHASVSNAVHLGHPRAIMLDVDSVANGRRNQGDDGDDDENGDNADASIPSASNSAFSRYSSPSENKNVREQFSDELRNL